MMENTAQSTPPLVQISKSEDFRDYYANNSFIQSTLWDLRILFGQVDQTIAGTPTVFKASVSMPWPQVKVMLYFVGLHLAGHEAKNGRIELPRGIIPELPVNPPDGTTELEWNALRKAWEDFVAANPESK